MTKTYYADDYDQNNTSRLRYFDNYFLELSAKMAQNSGQTLEQFFSQIRNITTFKAVLRAVFSLDVSLANYVEGMKSRDFQLFFERQVIQNIVNKNKENKLDEYVQDKLKIPTLVQQINKETRVFFPARIRGKRTIGYKDSVKVRGKTQNVFRDARGRFVSGK